MLVIKLLHHAQQVCYWHLLVKGLLGLWDLLIIFNIEVYVLLWVWIWGILSFYGLLCYLILAISRALQAASCALELVEMASFICCPSLWCNTVIILVNFIVLSERHFSCAIPLTFFILDVYSFNHYFCSWSTLVELLIEITRANLAAHAPNDFLILDIEIWHLANYHEALWGRYEFELIEIEIIIITNIILLVSSVPANWANFHTDLVMLLAAFDLFQ